MKEILEEDTEEPSIEHVPSFLRGDQKPKKETPVERKPEPKREPEEGIPTTESSALQQESVEELKRRQAVIQKTIEEKQQSEKQAVIDQIVDVVRMYNVPVHELVEALGGLRVKRKGVKAKIKYRDPISGATWSGRGKEPLWIRDQDRTIFTIGS